jgi:[NiFe] hydrogenase assembly HybE family chaperone
MINKLEMTFRHIEQTRMQGLSILNRRLSVKAVGFESWQDMRVGILLTPWFMNLMLLPDENWNQLAVGDIQHHNLPSGSYEFIVGHEEDIGYFLSCSLFSPVFEFEDQAAAVNTAEAALLAVMKSDKPNKSIDRREFLRGFIHES